MTRRTADVNETRKYVVRFTTQIELSVTVEVEDGIDEFEAEDIAAEIAHAKAEEYLQTLGNHRDIVAAATLGGIGHDEIEATK